MYAELVPRTFIIIIIIISLSVSYEYCVLWLLAVSIRYKVIKRFFVKKKYTKINSFQFWRNSDNMYFKHNIPSFHFLCSQILMKTKA